MPLPENVSTFCATCGLPMRTSRCDACGGNAQPLQLEDGDALSALEARGDASPIAREAWSRRDWASFVSHALAVEHVHDARSTRLSDGPGFVAVVDGVAVLVAVRQTAQQLVLEAPVARLPATMTVPAMRILLESSHAPGPGRRYAVRDDLVVARFVGRLDQDEPLGFGAALRGLVAAATEMADLLVATTDARMLAPSEHQALDFDSLPAGRFLGRVAHAAPPQVPSPVPSRRPQAAPFRNGAATAPAMNAVNPAMSLPTPTPTAAVPAGSGMPSPGRPAIPRDLSRPTASGAFEALMAPAPPPLHLPAPRAPDPFSQPNPGLGRSSPPTSEPSPGGGYPSSAPPPFPGEPPARVPGLTAKTVEVAQTPALRPPPGQTGRPTPLAVAAVPAPPLDRAPSEDRSVPPAPRMTTGGRGGDLASTQISAAPPPPGPKALCDLLHRAQTLGAVLSFADQPASMLLLVRATVYRAVFELLDGAPGAVSALFQETLPLTREIHITAPGKRRGSMAIPEAELAFTVFERIVAAGGVLPAAGPPAIEPITTAQDAKQHLARYVSEIDQAPQDLELRHFLGLGALCELVVRTKLPPQTLDRVRGIIARAVKEGARQSSIDLMMTALNRIVGG